MGIYFIVLGEKENGGLYISILFMVRVMIR